MPNVKPRITRSKIIKKNNYISTIKENKNSVYIFENLGKTRSIKSKKYSVSKITHNNPIGVHLSEILPFRVKFTNVGLYGRDTTSIPPIGIAIIGLNNYIL